MLTATPTGPAAAAPLTAQGRVIQLWQACCITAAVAVLYGPVFLKLVTDWWRNPDYSHGFIVPVFAGYLAWKRREVISSLSAAPTWFGLALVLTSVGVLFIGSLGAELFLARVSFLGVLVGLVLYFSGWRTLQVLAFPLAVLLLMIPLPAIIYNELVFPLQLLASKLATGCLRQTALVPVLREGNVLILPGIRLEVAEACSGIRSLMSLVAVATIYAYFAESRAWLRVVLVVLMLPVAVLANSMRVLFTALASQVWGTAVAEGWRHEVWGLVVFLFATAVLLLAHWVLTRLVAAVREVAT